MVEVKPQKDKFWKALILTTIIFLAGVALGYFLEEGRLNQAQKEFDQLFIDWNDARTQAMYYQNLELKECEQAIKENFRFGDKIYDFGLTLERYDESSRLSEALEIEKRKYNLLKLQFLINSQNLKEQCNEDYKFVIYFYQDDPKNVDIKSQQTVVSRVLGDLKQLKGDNIILIPLAVDFDMAIVNILIDSYNINEFPSVLIDESVVLTGVMSLDELEALV